MRCTLVGHVKTCFRTWVVKAFLFSISKVDCTSNKKVLVDVVLHVHTQRATLDRLKPPQYRMSQKKKSPDLLPHFPTPYKDGHMYEVYRTKFDWVSFI